jgi:hypothetical protein
MGDLQHALITSQQLQASVLRAHGTHRAQAEDIDVNIYATGCHASVYTARAIDCFDQKAASM